MACVGEEKKENKFVNSEMPSKTLLFALNKITVDNFQIVKQEVEVLLKANGYIDDFVDTVYKKAFMDELFCPLYIKLCAEIIGIPQGCFMCSNKVAEGPCPFDECYHAEVRCKFIAKLRCDLFAVQQPNTFESQSLQALLPHIRIVGNSYKYGIIVGRFILEFLEKLWQEEAMQYNNVEQLSRESSLKLLCAAELLLVPCVCENFYNENVEYAEEVRSFCDTLQYIIQRKSVDLKSIFRFTDLLEFIDNDFEFKYTWQNESRCELMGKEECRKQFDVMDRRVLKLV